MSEDILLKAIVNADNTVQYVPYTEEELEQRQLDVAAWATEQQERQAEVDRLNALKVSAKQKLIQGQPLTEDEASVVVI